MKKKVRGTKNQNSTFSTSNIGKSDITQNIVDRTIDSIRNPLKQLRYAERITSDYSNQKSNIVLPNINVSRNS